MRGIINLIAAGAALLALALIAIFCTLGLWAIGALYMLGYLS